MCKEKLRGESGGRGRSFLLLAPSSFLTPPLSLCFHSPDIMNLLLLATAVTQATALPPVRDPAFAPDGRLAVSFEGDLWSRDAAGRRWTRLTNGSAWDRQPAWAPDGQSIVFVSDREGGADLFRFTIRSGAVERLTSTPQPEAEPTVARDGSVAFVRGRGADSRI